MKNGIEAVLFDADGTVLDTREFVYQAFKYSMLVHTGEDVTWDQVAPILGAPLLECYRYLTNRDDVMLFCDSHVAFQNLEENLGLVVPFPNTIWTLESLRREGRSIGLVTTRFGTALGYNLRKTGLDRYFDVIVKGDDVTKHKPDSEPVLMALGKLNCSSERAVMIGDTDYDVLAGKNAQTLTIGVTYGFHGVKVAESKPDYLVDDIAEILPIILK